MNNAHLGRDGLPSSSLLARLGPRPCRSGHRWRASTIFEPRQRSMRARTISLMQSAFASQCPSRVSCLRPRDVRRGRLQPRSGTDAAAGTPAPAPPRRADDRECTPYGRGGGLDHLAPVGVMAASTRLRSPSSVTRVTSRRNSSRSIVFVTDAGCTIRRAPTLLSGSMPVRLNRCSTSTS